MHGVKRLFSWMIPRFDRERFNVSLVSLRKKDLSEETLESLGVDITYLERSKFDPMTLPAMLRLVDRAKQIDILHLHGYGATTFGRLAGAMRRVPTILHEHANLTDTPWFQKVADRLLAPCDRHRAGRVARARPTSSSAPGRFHGQRSRWSISACRSRSSAARGPKGKWPPRGANWASRPASSPSARSRGCTTRRATRISSTRRRGWSRAPGRAVLSRR